MDKKLKNFVIGLLRRGSYKWSPRNSAKKKCKVKVGEYSTGRAKYGYRCEHCKEVFMSKEVKMDHIDPVICPVKGWQGFDTYIERLFCDEDGIQYLCSNCHDKKTAEEREIRKLNKKLDKSE